VLVFDLQTALELTTRISACGLALSALELLSIRHHFGQQGVFSLGTVSSFRRHLPALRLTDRYISVFITLQFVTSASLVVFGPFSLWGRMSLLLAFLATTIVRWRRCSGGDGAEQMTTIVFAAVCFSALPYPSTDRMVAATTFIAAQVSLSYVTAGVAKLISPTWRSGSALPAILSTYSHGHPWAAQFVHQHIWVTQLASWIIIIFECLFPLLLFGSSHLAVIALVCGFSFHAGCAVFMGLNSFLWSFPAAYPCVLVAVFYWKELILKQTII
jgi:hypothetical protein